jgi:serine/threonine protein kinase
MGEVYKARDERLNRLVAIKFLTAELSVSGEERDRFTSEARAASALNHSNICTIHDIDEVDGKMFIVMEFIEGQTLRQRMDAGVLSIAEATRVAVQVTDGLKAAHTKGIVHGDIKPENILITNEGLAKIADFGVARTHDRSPVPETGLIPGTIGYMSPEQLLGTPSGPLADIWSLGVMLYEMVAGRRPFRGDYEQAIMYSILNEKQPPVSAIRPEISASLEEIIERCLQKKPAERFQETGALLDALRRIQDQPGSPRPPAAKSIAILPFTDLSPEQDNKYFSDGLTEEIIANLSRLRNVKIISRASVMQFERTGKSMKQIGSELGVQYVLEGGVRKSGSDLRITAQLIDAAQDAYLWSEKYSGTMGQIFDFQEDVAARIVKALRMRLTPGERKNLKRRSTQNTEAYQLYLKGRFFWNKRSKEALITAIRYFEEAINIDGRYAQAWAGIADSYNLLSESESIPRKETYPKARAAAGKALELDGRLAEAHASLALGIMLNELDWKTAEKEFKLAISLNPNYPTSHHWYTEWLLYNGRTTEALREIAKASELDPLSPAILKDWGLALYYARDYDGAIERARKSLELDPNFNLAHRVLSLAYQGKKMFEEAIAENRLWGELTEHKNDALVALAQCYAAAGKKSQARELLDGLDKEKLPSGNQLRGLGLVYASLGEPDQAFTWFEKAFERKAESLCSLKVDPKVDGLRNDPRFTALLKKVGLVP